MLAPDVDVCPLTLPGRGARFAEPPFVVFDELISALTSSIQRLLPRDFIFYGHSLGATVSLELAHRLYSQLGRAPMHLFVSGARPPHLRLPGTAAIQEGESTAHALLDNLRSAGGTPTDVLKNRAMLEVVAPIVNADMTLYDNYRPPTDPATRKLPCPITAFGGTDDLSNIPERALQEWRHYGTRSTVQLVPGGHFFIHDQAALITRRLLRTLSESSDLY